MQIIELTVVGFDVCRYCSKHHPTGKTVIYAKIKDKDPDEFRFWHYEAYCNKKCLLFARFKESK
jgi:hypothetical protein